METKTEQITKLRHTLMVAVEPAFATSSDLAMEV